MALDPAIHRSIKDATAGRAMQMQTIGRIGRSETAMRILVLNRAFENDRREPKWNGEIGDARKPAKKAKKARRKEGEGKAGKARRRLSAPRC